MSDFDRAAIGMLFKIIGALLVGLLLASLFVALVVPMGYVFWTVSGLVVSGVWWRALFTIGMFFILGATGTSTSND